MAKRYRYFLILFFALSLFNIVIGGTRSVIISACVLSILLMAKNIRLAIKIMPLILLVVFASQPYTKKAIHKTTMETKDMTFNDFKNILNETEYRTAFTGRVHLWQDIWSKYKSSSVMQKVFGTGLTSNAHSSYFFLLLQIGMFGMLFYIFFHLKLIFKLLDRNLSNPLILAGILALITILLIGTSASTVMYTSFQWIIYLIVGSSLNIATKEIHVGEVELKPTMSI